MMAATVVPAPMFAMAPAEKSNASEVIEQCGDALFSTLPSSVSGAALRVPVSVDVETQHQQEPRLQLQQWQSQPPLLQSQITPTRSPVGSMSIPQGCMNLQNVLQAPTGLICHPTDTRHLAVATDCNHQHSYMLGTTSERRPSTPSNGTMLTPSNGTMLTPSNGTMLSRRESGVPVFVETRSTSTPRSGAPCSEVFSPVSLGHVPQISPIVGNNEQRRQTPPPCSHPLEPFRKSLTPSSQNRYSISNRNSGVRSHAGSNAGFAPGSSYPNRSAMPLVG